MDETAEKGSRSGATGANRYLRSRLRATRKQAQGREVEACGSGTLYRWTGVPITEEIGESDAKSGAAQSKGDGWGKESVNEG